MGHFELCPMCGVLQEMNVSAFHSEVVDVDGHPRTSITVVYHCKSCGALARHENIHEERAEIPTLR
jgi:hypothetical protein